MTIDHIRGFIHPLTVFFHYAGSLVTLSSDMFVCLSLYVCVCVCL